jgi:hypothetical protein
MNTPHSYRRQSIHAILLCLITVIVLLACSCSPRMGCPGHQGYSGYSLQELRKNKNIAYLYCPNTGIVGVWDAKGKLSCIYYISK